MFNNWLLVLLCILAVTVLALRTPLEELIERFGDDYRTYTQRTGRLGPKMRRRR